MPTDVTLPHLIAERAAQMPNSPFLVHVDGTRWTWKDLHDRSLDWACALADRGIKSGDRVVVMMPPSLDAVAVWLGIAWLKAIEVPLHTAYRGRMLEYTVTHVDPKLAVIHADFTERFAEIEAQLPPQLDVIVLGGTGTATTGAASARFTSDAEAVQPHDGRAFDGPQAHDLACILYTSGTTGPSKGVMVPWAQLQSMSEACIPIEALGPDDVWYSPYPTFHASGKIPVYAMALVGGQVAIRERFSTSAFWSDVEQFGVTATMMIGASAGLIVDRYNALGLEDTSLQHVLVSPPPAEPEAFEKSLGIRICSVFNMTELSAPISTGWRQMTDRTCGQVRSGYEARIVDEHDNELPRGVPGELIVRADRPWTLNAGYWNMPEQTATAWRNGWFHTGDVCMQSEAGEFYFVDRLKDAIRRRGENISSMEIEVMVTEHPHVLECAAYGVPAELGEEEVMIAVVVTNDGGFDPHDLNSFLTARLPKFMVPRYVEVLEELPRTPTEKVRKGDLRKRGVSSATWDSVAS